MKTVMKLFAFFAIAAFALSACTKEPVVPSSPEMVNIIVKAVPESFSNPETKTYIDNTQTILWGQDEYMTIGVLAGESQVFATSAEAGANGKKEAFFSFSLTPGATADQYTYVGVYPASAVVNYNASPAYSDNDDATAFKVSLPSTQNATATSYDPSAYIMVAKPEPFNAIQTEWTASYRRATALNKVTLMNIPEDIVSVEFTAPEGVYMAGRRYINLATGESGNLYGDTRTETIEVKASLSGDSKVVWFTSWGVEIPVGKTFTIVAKSANKSYSRTLTVANNSITFKEGFLNTLKVNMASAEVEDLENYAGNYLIGSKPDSKWILMTPEKHSNNYFIKADTDVTVAPENVSFSDFSDVDDYIWTVSKVEGGYAIQSVKTGKYIALTSNGNAAYVSDDPMAFSLVITDDKKATVKSNEYTTRVLRYNSSNPRFAFYEGTQKDIYMIPAEIDTRPKAATPTFNPESGTVDANTEITISSETEGATIFYTIDGTNPTTSSTSGSTVIITEATTVKAIAVKEGYKNSDVATAVYSITGVSPKGTEENPYTVAEAIAAVDAGQGITDVYVKGIISKIVTAYNSTYGNVSFNFSEDGTESGNQFQAFRAVATSDSDFVIGDGVLMHGNLKKYNSTYELDAACTAADLVRVPTFTPSDNTVFDSNLSVSIAAAEGVTIRYTTDGTNPTDESSVYSTALSLTETTTVKAVAFKGVINSAMASATYTKNDPLAPIVLNADTDNFPSGYGTANAFTKYTLGDLNYMIQQVYVNGAKLQWRAAGNSNGTGTIYNNDAMPAGITSIVIVYNSSDSNKNHTVQIGSSANPSSTTAITPSISGNTYTFAGDGTSRYFVITNGSGAGYIDSITINFK